MLRSKFSACGELQPLSSRERFRFAGARAVHEGAGGELGTKTAMRYHLCNGSVPLTWEPGVAKRSPQRSEHASRRVFFSQPLAMSGHGAGKRGFPTS
jgi:hypothetical protein